MLIILIIFYYIYNIRRGGRGGGIVLDFLNGTVFTFAEMLNYRQTYVKFQMRNNNELHLLRKNILVILNKDDESR